MRFQCRIGDGTVMPLPPSLPVPRTAVPPAPLAVLPKRRGKDKRHGKLARGVAASAVLLAATGCALFEPAGPKPWKVEPVFNVTHSAQSSQAYYALGQYFDGSMAWDKAIDAYRKAIAADANNIDAYDALGVALAQAGRLADAEITLRQAVALSPQRLRVRNNLGYVLLLSGKPDEATVVLKSVVDQDGGHAIARANLSSAMERSAGTTASTAVAAAEPAPVVDVAPAPLSAPATPPAASRLEVSNGNGVAGMAARVGRWLAAHGVRAERLTNRQPFTQRQTVIQYRAGQEDAALQVARLLPASAKAESAPTPGLRSDVRVVLGHDWVQAAACLERNTCQPASASVAMAAQADR